MAVKAIAIISRLEKIFLRTRLSRPYQNVSKCYHTVIKMFLLKLQTFSVKSQSGKEQNILTVGVTEEMLKPVSGSG